MLISYSISVLHTPMIFGNNGTFRNTCALQLFFMIKKRLASINFKLFFKLKEDSIEQVAWRSQVQIPPLRLYEDRKFIKGALLGS